MARVIYTKVTTLPTSPIEGEAFLYVQGQYRQVIVWDGTQWQSMSRIPATYAKVVSTDNSRTIQIPNLVPNSPIQVFHSLVLFKDKKLTLQQQYTITTGGLVKLTDQYPDDPQPGDVWEFIVTYSN